ncbi:DUF547 domain-containing protein [Leptolyngbya sp. DQ-M1]|uniref:DUF547 domain-containing protein n=1 Tax=Leptolyngbya sp. DQ-M1 TaxID=2933920 RepID=UPI003296AED6
MDFEPWNKLLQTYVNDRGQVDYVRWKQEQPNAVREWISSLEWSDPTPDEQLSLWINLYNAFVIEKILPRYPIRSIQPKILGIPNWIAFFQFFFNRDRTAFNQKFSLGQIENERLRKQFQDPRIHFAIVCASIGCPLLRNEAYFPNRVNQQLEADKNRFIQNPEKVKYDADRNVLHCSKIFKWYRQDFLNVAPSIAEYINPAIPKNARISYLDYDWSLNQIPTY